MPIIKKDKTYCCLNFPIVLGQIIPDRCVPILICIQGGAWVITISTRRNLLSPGALRATRETQAHLTPHQVCDLYSLQSRTNPSKCNVSPSPPHRSRAARDASARGPKNMGNPRQNVQGHIDQGHNPQVQSGVYNWPHGWPRAQPQEPVPPMWSFASLPTSLLLPNLLSISLVLSLLPLCNIML
jgi:hypothetical protein